MRAFKHRVGFLIPSPNFVIEPEYAEAFPEDISLHYARLTMTEVSERGFARQDEDVVPQAEGLGNSRVDAVLYCITVASMVLGLDYDRRLTERLSAAARGVPAVTVATAVVEAMKALELRRIVIASPFPANANQTSIGFMEGNGFQVVGTAGLGITDNYYIGLVPRSDVIRLAIEADRPDADAIVMPGGALPCMDAIEELEATLKKPVVTTNQAGMWAVLRRLGGYGRIEGYGRLLTDHMG